MPRDRLSRKRRSWLISTSARARLAELAFQPFDGGEVEMVGRLVQQQDVGRGRQHPRERRAARLAAGQMRGILLAGEAQLLQQIVRLIVIVAGRRARPRHRPASSRGRRNPAPAADSARSRRAARSGCRCPARPAPAAIFSSVDLPEPLRPTRQTRSPGDTDELDARRAAACRRRSARCP